MISAISTGGSARALTWAGARRLGLLTALMGALSAHASESRHAIAMHGYPALPAYQYGGWKGRLNWARSQGPPGIGGHGVAVIGTETARDGARASRMARHKLFCKRMLIT